MKTFAIGLAFALAATGGVRVSMAQAEARSVRMLIGFSTGTEKRTAQVVVKEGEAGVLDIPALGKFAFTPTSHKEDATVFDVALDDASQTPPKRVATTTVKTDGPSVDTGTTPAFQIAIRLPKPAK